MFIWFVSLCLYGLSIICLLHSKYFPQLFFWVCSQSISFRTLHSTSEKNQLIKGDLLIESPKLVQGCFVSMTEKYQGSFLLSTIFSSSKAVLNFTILLVADCPFSRFHVSTPHCVETDFHWPSELSEEPSVPYASPIWRPKFNYMSFFLIRTNSWVYCLGQSDLYRSWWQRQQGYLGRLNQSVLTPKIYSKEVLILTTKQTARHLCNGEEAEGMWGDRPQDLLHRASLSYRKFFHFWNVHLSEFSFMMFRFHIILRFSPLQVKTLTHVLFWYLCLI